MDKYKVTGMSCAACSARVERAVGNLTNVDSCAVSLLTNSMTVEGAASPEEVIKAVREAGYDAGLMGEGGEAAGTASSAAPGSISDYENLLTDTTTGMLKNRLLASLGFLLVLMYVSMGHVMWGWPLPAFFTGNPVAVGLVEMLLAIIVMVINRRFFVNGWKGIIHRAPNMDTLVAMGSAASFVYSVYALFAMTAAGKAGDMGAAHEWLHEFYFESAAMILTLITVGKMLEARSKGKTTDALKSLLSIAPKTAVLLVEGEEKTVPASEVRIGDTFVLRPGMRVPVDGVVLSGMSAMDESALTGESIPVDKEEGDTVSASTINQSGYLVCRATRVGEDTTLSQIIRMVGDAAATKAPVARIADKVSAVFVPTVIGIALVTLIVWLICGAETGFALARAISVLVISCPCALGLATPVAIMVGNGIGAKNGILFKNATALEACGKAQIVVLDKTGTITSGVPEVTDILPAENYDEQTLLRYAAALEAGSEHPLAKAVVAAAQGRNDSESEKPDMPPVVSGFRALPGNGVEAMVDGKQMIGGSIAFVAKNHGLSGSMKEKAEALAGQGKTPLVFLCDGALMGLIAVADVIREDSPQAIGELKNMGIKVVMLTGDNAITAKAIGDRAGVDKVVAGVLPDGKEAVIRKLQEYGKVAMVGDGINDAPALTRADTGIAIGAGTDVAIDAAQVVLVKSRLSDVAAAIRLSRRTLRNIHENLFWAFFYNVIGIPLAAGCYIALLGWKLNPMFGAAAMSLSSFCVVSNALRLNLMKLYETKKDRMLKHPAVIDESFDEMFLKTEENTMKKTINVEGMMCMHCEKIVRTALEALPGVEAAEVSHEAGTAIVTLTAEVADDVLKKAVEDEDFKVTGIQ